MDPYNDSDPAFAATPLSSPTAIPTFHNCPRARFLPPGGNRDGPQHAQGGYPNNNNQRPFQFGGPQQGPLRYDPNHGFQPQGYPPHGRGHPAHNPYQQQPPQQHAQLMRPLTPATEYLVQHLDVFQAVSYDLPDDCYKIISSTPEEVNLDLFCIQEIVENLVESKKQLRSVPQELFGRARQRCNPYELVGSSIFMNRASVKLASLDSQLALTANKEDPTGGQGSEESTRTFRFVDLCSGPGGFSEYLLWRKHTWGERARGWAMTLKGDLDFQLERFHKDAAVQETLRVFYGKDGTGDILKQDNIDAFAEMVDLDTRGLGVGLVSADGGVSVDGDEAVQETLLQRLILCQILTMFMTLQKGGDFVIKVFDIFTPVTAGMIWILSRHFQKICVVKPLTSRPMNSERYVVCRHLLQRRPAKTIEHLRKVNARYQEIEDRSAAGVTSTTEGDGESNSGGTGSREEVTHIVDLKILTGDMHFMDYIKRNNRKTAIRQTEALDVFLKYVNEGLRPAFDQEAIKRLCLEDWRIPPRPQPYHPQQHQQHHQQHRHPSQQHSNSSARHHPYQSAHHYPHPQPPQQQGPPSRGRPPYPNSRAPPPQTPQGGGRQGSGGGRGQPGLLDSLLNNMQPPPGPPRY